MTINERPRHDGPIVLVEYDPKWVLRFEREAHRIRAALGTRALLLEHAGSTSVPGLVAKPIIDIVLAVPDSSNEDDYVPALEAEGYLLRIREPDWYEHRMLRKTDPSVNLHVFSADCPEIDRMLAFRDHLGRTRPTTSCTSGRSGSWRRSTGPTSRTTRTRRATSSRKSSRAPSPDILHAGAAGLLARGYTWAFAGL